jgi:hypothetical protein
VTVDRLVETGPVDGVVGDEFASCRPFDGVLDRKSERGDVAMPLTIVDKTVLVTGANRGLGWALVEEALRRGGEAGVRHLTPSVGGPR